jgi:hypothetical protein
MARKAYFARLALLSAKARRNKAACREGAGRNVVTQAGS